MIGKKKTIVDKNRALHWTAGDVRIVGYKVGDIGGRWTICHRLGDIHSSRLDSRVHNPIEDTRVAAPGTVDWDVATPGTRDSPSHKTLEDGIDGSLPNTR